MRTIWLTIVALTAFTAGSFAQTVERKNDGRFGNPPPIVASSWSGFYLGLGLGFRATRTDATVTSELLGPPLHPVDLGPIATGQPRRRYWISSFTLRWVQLAICASLGRRRGGRCRLCKSDERARRFSGSSCSDRGRPQRKRRSHRKGYVGCEPARPSRISGDTINPRLCDRRRRLAALRCDIDLRLQRLWQSVAKVVSDSTTKAGWTVGGGLETVLWGNWLARAEYRYADFGTSSLQVARAGTIGVPPTPFASSDNVDVRLHTHMATFGLAYKFGEPIVGDAAGAFASSVPPDALTWSGLYAGLALGARASQSELTTSSAIVGHLIDLTGSATSQSFDGTGFRGSPYVGFNWQFMPRWLVGIEGDVGLRKSNDDVVGKFHSGAPNRAAVLTQPR